MHRETGHAEHLRRVGPHHDADPALVQGLEHAPAQRRHPPTGLGVAGRGPLVRRPLPPLDGLGRHVAHLGTGGAELGGRPVAEEHRLPEHHRRHHPGSGRAGGVDEFRQPSQVRAVEQLADPEEPAAIGRKRLVGHEGFDVVVEVVDGGLSRRERAPQPDRVGHAAPERQADLGGGRRHRVEDVGRQPFVHLHQVVAALVVLAHQLLALRGRGGAFPGQRRAADEQPRPQGLAAGDARPQPELRAVARHAPDGGHPVGDVEEEQVAGVGLHHARTGQVPVHVGQARHQVHPFGRDHLGAFGHLHLVGRMQRRDPPAGHHHRPVLDDPGHAGLGHRDDVHAHEGQVSPHLRQGVAAPRREGGDEPRRAGEPPRTRSHAEFLPRNPLRRRARPAGTAAARAPACRP